MAHLKELKKSGRELFSDAALDPVEEEEGQEQEQEMEPSPVSTAAVQVPQVPVVAMDELLPRNNNNPTIITPDVRIIWVDCKEVPVN